jgi:nicotinamidase/pyrazinamidase
VAAKTSAGSALFIVDVQNDFCPGGALPVPHGDRVIPVLNQMIRRFVLEGRLVYASRDWHPPDTSHFKAFGGPWPVHCVAGTPGADFHPDLRLPEEAVLISKGQDRADAGYSAFEGTSIDGRPLGDDLQRRGITTLFVGGLATDYCVRATVLDARRASLRVIVMTDAIAGIGADDSTRALEEMKEAGASLMGSTDA